MGGKAETSGVKYGDVVQRLDEVVRRLEAGDLSLEDSLKAFEEGIRLVRSGEKLLGEAERRIEQLLVEDGEDKAAPLSLGPSGAEAAPPPARKTKPPAADEDVPF
jgi:exodeoxyribonuclease VII small subunit